MSTILVTLWIICLFMVVIFAAVGVYTFLKDF